MPDNHDQVDPGWKRKTKTWASMDNRADRTVEKLHAVFGASCDGLVEVEVETNTIHVSARAKELLGIAEGFTGTLDEIMTPHLSEGEAAMLRNTLQDLLQGGHSECTVELQYLTREGDAKPLRLMLFTYAARIDEARQLIVMVRDVSEEQMQARTIDRLAYCDTLTGLGNRTALLDALEHLMRVGAAPFHLVVFDIRAFNDINTLFGFEIGDRILKQAAMHLIEMLPGNHFIARIGGDDFAINDGKILVVFQPILDLRTGKAEVFESLTRWNSEQFGMVSPEVFVELAENTGMIHELGRYVLRSACGFAAEINRDGGDRLVTVNVSSHELLRDDFAEELSKTIFGCGIPARWIGIEVTESAAIMDMKNALIVLDQIRSLGFRILLDDFGKGYSSLSYLAQLPIDILKIDKSFIDVLHTSARGYQMVRTMRDMARNFQILVLAEGVEEDVQASLLSELGCELIQGYWYSRPLARAEAVKARRQPAIAAGGARHA